MTKKQLVAQLKRRYTGITTCTQYRTTYKVWLISGPQSFLITTHSIDNAKEAKWFQDRLAHALAVIVKENK